MKSRKLMALATTTVLAASLLAGCNSGKDEETTTVKTTENGTNPSGDDSSDFGTRVESSNKYGLCDEVKDGTILHCFAWSFDTINESMEDIAMSGYTAIQTSPINACYDGGDGGMDLFGQGKWFYHYQPTDWTIGNYQLGTKEDFQTMCETAHSYGIKVIVDVVPNHTTKSTEAISKDFIKAVGGEDKLYHSNGKAAISDYSDRTQCTLLACGGLYDVNTENPDFQEYFINYLNECISCGADGFRYDTAKHIGLPDDPKDDSSLENNFWTRVTSEITDADKIFNYGEVLQDGGERIADYIDTIGATTASSYGFSLRSAIVASNFTATTISNLKIGSAAPNVVTWVESHDNYTGDDATYKVIDNQGIITGWAVLAARSEGTPLFFSRPYGASDSAMWGTFNKIGMVGDNLYKDPTVVAVNRFRNAMNGLNENLFNPSTEATSVLFIERGSKGLVIINSSMYDQEFTDISTNLENGDYTDRVTGETFTVADGKISAKLSKKQIVVLYNEGYVELSAPAVVKVDDATTSTIVGKSLDVTLKATNAAKATYSIDGKDEVEFKDGDVVTIGKKIKPDQFTKLTLRAENADGNKTCITYVFKKADAITTGTKIYFEKPASWGTNVSAYVYDETSSSVTQENAGWPGVAMELEKDGTYSYTFTKDWVAPLVIFTDGTNQSNGALEPGASVVADKVYSLN